MSIPLFQGCSDNADENKDTPKKEIAVEQPKDKEEKLPDADKPTDEKTTENTDANTTSNDNAQDESSDAEENANEKVITPEVKPATTNSGSGGLANRTVSDNKETTALENIARNLEAKKLVYDHTLGQDCSGIYHQIKDSIQLRISELGDLTKYKYPTFKEVRSSRQIADWYYRNNNLLIVQNA